MNAIQRLDRTDHADKRIVIASGNDGENCFVKVCDNGFQPFEDYIRRVNDQDGAFMDVDELGVGLFVAWHIASGMNGSVRIDTDPDHVCFSLILPAGEAM